MPQRKKPQRGSAYPAFSEINNVANLSFRTDKYQDFDYTKVGNLKISNFAGGGLKTLKKLLKESYASYMQGGASKIRQIRRGGAEYASLTDLTVPREMTNNIAGLGHTKPFQIPKITKIQQVPLSNFML